MVICFNFILQNLHLTTIFEDMTKNNNKIEYQILDSRIFFIEIAI
jgi:hypothetical protein